MPAPLSDVTEALGALRRGEAAATERLVGAVYAELHLLAHAQRRRERADHTLNTTALVHEAYLKLLGPQHHGYDSRSHFFAAAARAMRQVLVDHARARGSAKRGAGRAPLSLDALQGPAEPADPGLLSDAAAAVVLDVDAALGRLVQVDERQVRIVECRYFGGLSVEETAETLGISTATVKREWRAARAWLYAALHDGGATGGGAARTA